MKKVFITMGTGICDVCPSFEVYEVLLEHISEISVEKFAQFLWQKVKIISLENTRFYAPNFEKVGSILVSACAFVRPSVRSKKKLQARVLKFHIWIPCRKIAYPYFFSCLNYLPLPSYAPLKGLRVQFCK